MNNLNQMGTFNPQRSQFSSYFNPATGASASTNNIVWVQGIEGAAALALSRYVSSVDEELAHARQQLLEYRSIDFDIVEIMSRQDDLYKKYKRKLKELEL